MTNAEKQAKMQANSKEWHTATPERRKELEAENQRLGKEVGGTYDSGTGKWSDSSGNDLYDYSSITGGTSNTTSTPTPTPLPYNPTTSTSTLTPLPYNPTSSSPSYTPYNNSNYVYANGLTYEENIKKMQGNTSGWHTAGTQAERDAMSAENQYIGSLLGATYDSATGKWKNSSGNDLYDYSAIVGGTQTPKAQGTPITYYDKQGNPYTGYTIDNKTYKDAAGTQRIDVGMLVPTADGKTWYEMTPTGGVQVGSPLWTNPEYLNLQAQVEALKSALFSADTSDLQGYQDLIQAAYDKVANFQAREAMSQEEARVRAEADVGGTYDENIAQLINAYQQNAISRGMFGQTPTEALKMEALAANELDRAKNISSTASDIQAQDFNQKQILDQNDLDRYLSEANLGQTLYSTEMQEIQMEMENRINALKYHQQQQADKYSKAMDKLNTLGYADAEVAKALGIPEGTLSTDDRVAQAEFDRQKELMAYEQQLNKEMADYQASLSAKYRGSSGGGGGNGGNGDGLLDDDTWLDYLARAESVMKNATASDLAELEALGIVPEVDQYGQFSWKTEDVATFARYLANMRDPNWLAQRKAEQEWYDTLPNAHLSFTGDDQNAANYLYSSPYHTYLDSTGTLRYNYQNNKGIGSNAITDSDKKKSTGVYSSTGLR